jgi:adenosine deaminase
LQTELHRHLDVSVRSSTLLALAQKEGIEGQSTSLAEFRKKLLITEQLGDLGTVLARFALFPRLLARPETLEQVAFECVEDCRAEGTRQVELRFSPTFVTEFSKLAWDEALSAFERGIKRARARYPEMRAGLICIASRDFGVEGVERTAEFFLQHRARFVGFDLAGNEVGFPCRLFENAFKKLRSARANITVHAGEGCGPENIWEAIELLGAKRIGHGIACIQDPKLMEVLRDRAICLEMCPTSNWLTRCVPSFEAHPLPLVLRAGIPVCINTDDPGIFDVTMTGELQICREKMGMSDADISQCEKHAMAASFIIS